MMDEQPKKMDMKTIAMIVYGCWIAGVLSHMLPFFGILPLVGLIIAFIKRPEAAGTIYESHFQWVIRTFVIGIIAAVGLAILLIIPPVAILGYGALAIWGLYRLVRGGLKLLENKPIDNPTAFI